MFHFQSWSFYFKNRNFLIYGCSDGEIKKYIPKQRQKRKRSDPEWNQYMEKCMLAGLYLMFFIPVQAEFLMTL